MIVENVVVDPHSIKVVPTVLLVVCRPTISLPHWQYGVSVGEGPNVFVILTCISYVNHLEELTYGVTKHLVLIEVE